MSTERRPFEILQVWIVGSYPDGGQWEIQGVYTSQALAETHAIKGWFIGAVLVDTPLPFNPTDWPGAYFVGDPE